MLFFRAADGKRDRHNRKSCSKPKGGRDKSMELSGITMLAEYDIPNPISYIESIAVDPIGPTRLYSCSCAITPSNNNKNTQISL